jgi:hypothetical protein
MVEEETMHYASMALYHLSCCAQTTEALIRHGAHQVLVRIAASPSTACRLQAARALARLCLDVRWQHVLLAFRVMGPLVELALQALFTDMQRDALMAIKTLASNPQLRETVLAELRVSMGARAIFIAGHEGRAMRNCRLNGAPADAAPEGEVADGEEKENTPPQDRLLSLGANSQKSKLHSGFI